MQYFKQALREATSPINIKRDLALMNRFQRVYMVVIMAVTIWAFVYTGDYSSSGWTSLITGLVLAFYLIMLASGWLTNFFWGLLTNGIWLLMSIHNHLVGDILNQGFFFVMQFVGMVAWYKQLAQQQDSSQMQAKRIGPKMMGCLVAGVVVVYGVVLAVAKTAHGNQVYLDSSQLPLGMLAQILATYGYLSQWVVWLLVDAVGLLLWWNQIQAGGSGALGMFVLMIVKTFNAFYGMYLWSKTTEYWD